MKNIKLLVKLAAFAMLFMVACLMTGCTAGIGSLRVSVLEPVQVAQYDYDDGVVVEPETCWYDGYEEVGYCNGTLMCWYGGYWEPAPSEVVLRFDFYRNHNYGWEHRSYRNGHHSIGGHSGGYHRGSGSRRGGGNHRGGGNRHGRQPIGGPGH